MSSSPLDRHRPRPSSSFLVEEETEDHPQRTRLLRTALVHLDSWRKSISEGKGLVEDIADLRRQRISKEDHNNKEEEEEEEDHRGDWSSSDAAAEMQELCLRLGETCASLDEVVTGLRMVRDKMKGLNELEEEGQLGRGGVQSPSSIVLPRQLSSALEVVAEAYDEQSRICRCVLENVCLCASEDELVFHAVAWIHQPGVAGERCEQAMSLLTYCGESYKNKE